MEDYSGIEILKIARDQPYDPEVLLITAFGSVDSAVEAIKMGAYDYLEKPLDLKKLVLIIEGRRLHVIAISVPPLRERREAIAPMLNHFIEKYSRKFKKKVRGFLPESLSALIQYDWPGNARELENFVERMVSLSGSSLIKPSELKNFISLRESPSEKPLFRPQNLKLSVLYDTIEKEHILKILKKNLRNISKGLGKCQYTGYDFHRWPMLMVS